MQRLVLYTGESSLALFELGHTLYASKERLADDDTEFSIDPRDIAETADADIVQILKVESLSIIRNRKAGTVDDN